MIRPLILTPLALLALAVSGVVAATDPAQARSEHWFDPAGGAGGLLDIRSVKVTNNSKGVRIVVRTNPIDTDAVLPSGSFTLLIDTKPKKQEAEFREEFWIPGDGGFTALKGSKSWKKSWETYPWYGKCGKTVRERWKPESGRIITHIKPKRGCLWHPRNVSVQVKTQTDGELDADYDFTEYDSTVRDYFPARAEFSKRVRYSKN